MPLCSEWVSQWTLHRCFGMDDGLTCLGSENGTTRPHAMETKEPHRFHLFPKKPPRHLEVLPARTAVNRFLCEPLWHFFLVLGSRQR